MIPEAYGTIAKTSEASIRLVKDQPIMHGGYVLSAVTNGQSLSLTLSEGKRNAQDAGKDIFQSSTMLQL